MTRPAAEIIAEFRESVPDTLYRLTELWAGVEAGDRKGLDELKRVLHTLKGETQLLGLDRCSRLAELIEAVVHSWERTVAAPSDIGDVVRAAFAALLRLAKSREHADPSDLELLCVELELVVEELAAAARMPASMTDPDGAATYGNDAEGAPRERGDGGGLRPHHEAIQGLPLLLDELRRLEDERAVGLSDLRAAHRSLRALLEEVDFRINPELPEGRVGATLADTHAVVHRISGIEARWAASHASESRVLQDLEAIIGEVSNDRRTDSR